MGRRHAPVRMSSCHSSKCFGFLPLASPLPNCSSVAALFQLLQLCCSSSSHSLPHCQIARLIGEECCLGSSALNACLECGGVLSWLWRSLSPLCMRMQICACVLKGEATKENLSKAHASLKCKVSSVKCLRKLLFQHRPASFWRGCTCWSFRWHVRHETIRILSLAHPMGTDRH